MFPHRQTTAIGAKRHLAGEELHGGIGVRPQVAHCAQLDAAHTAISCSMLAGEGDCSILVSSLLNTSSD